MGAAKVKKANGKYPAQTEKVMPISKPITHYTAADIIPLFQTNAAIERAGATVVPLLNGVSGYLRFSDVNGGTAYLVNAEEKLASLSVSITEEMREAKCFNPNCDCGGDWKTLIHGCGAQDEHEDVYDTHLVPIKLFAGLCQNPKCTEQHVWLLSECIDTHAHHNNHAQIL